MNETTRSEFQIVPLKQVVESKTNPRRHFDEKGLQELTESVKSHGVLVPLLVRPIGNHSFSVKKSDAGWDAWYVRNPHGVTIGLPIENQAEAENEAAKLTEKHREFEIIAGARRYRASKAAGLKDVPVRICAMTEEQVLEVQIVENSAREDIHPLEEAEGYRTLQVKFGWDVAEIATRVSKSESFVYQRLKLADLIEPAKKLFFEEEITAGHAILIARLQPKDQQEILKDGLYEGWGDHRGVGSVRGLSRWIQQNIHLDLNAAPFKKDDADLVPAAGSCITCPKRTGFLPALFPDIAKKDTCTDRTCFDLKLQAHIAKKKTELEASGKVLQITTDYGHGRGTDKGLLSASSYERVDGKKDHCDSAEKAIVVEGRSDRGRVVEICRDPKCPKHGRGRLYSGSGSSSDRYRADQKRKEEKARNETTLRRRILDGILAVGRKEPSTEDLRLIAAEFWSRTLHDNQKVIADRRSWEIESKKHQYGSTTRDFSGAGKKAIAAAGIDGLMSLLLEISLISDTSVGVYDVTDKKQLLETAKRYKVDVKSIEKQFNAEISEKKAKKVAREKKKTIAAKAGTKSAKAETNGAKRGTNGAERGTPAPFHVRVKPQPRKGEHACEVCKCTESYACEGGCWWDHEYLKKKRYVCNNCIDLAAQMEPGPRRRKSVQSSANEASV